MERVGIRRSAQRFPPDNSPEEALEFLPEHPRGCKRGAMFKFIIGNRKALVPHASLYCVWVRAQNAPLVRVWIDPSMTMFESQVRVHEPDMKSARAALQAGPREGSAS